MTPDWPDLDRRYLWHPYSAIGADLPVFPHRPAAELAELLVSLTPEPLDCVLARENPAS